MIEPRFYTGIGSRAAPQSALTRAEALAYSLTAKGFRGRSGKAPGMDQAFMAGAARFYQQNNLEGVFTNYTPNSNFQCGLGCPAGVEDVVAPALANWIEAVAGLVGNAGSMMPGFQSAGQLRGVLGRLNQGECQQGCDAGE